MKLFIGSDHAGYLLKEDIKKHLSNNNKYEVVDIGTDSKESVDYPKFGKQVATEVSKKDGSLGIVVCGSGIGISISANKVKGIRAALVSNENMAKSSKEHNNANVLALGQENQNSKTAIKYVDIFLNTTFNGEERHKRRNKDIEK